MVELLGQVEKLMSDWAETVRAVWAAKRANEYRSQAEGVQSFQANPGLSLDLTSEDARSPIPKSVLEAYDYYFQQVGAADWGSVTASIETIQNQEVYAIAVSTDGDDGWVELFDRAGQPLGAARTLEASTAWGETAAIRAYTQDSDLPQELQAKRNSESASS